VNSESNNRRSCRDACSNLRRYSELIYYLLYITGNTIEITSAETFPTGYYPVAKTVKQITSADIAFSRNKEKELKTTSLFLPINLLLETVLVLSIAFLPFQTTLTQLHNQSKCSNPSIT
jgi:hypothetical protein